MTDDLAPRADDLAPLPAADAAALPAADASLLALVDRLAVLLERSDLTELEVEAGGTGIILRKATAPAASAPAAAGVPGEAATAAHTAATGSPAGAASGIAGSTGATPADPPASTRAAVLAPLTGIFYASPSPGSPPFVEAGREVVVGQVIGLIEAMKLFNEIKSDKAGRVVRVVAEDGTLVKAKHPLIEVEPL
jgi:acetyl-CoA carboxylase biotin carboxyl carrier protein